MQASRAQESFVVCSQCNSDRTAGCILQCAQARKAEVFFPPTLAKGQSESIQKIQPFASQFCAQARKKLVHDRARSSASPVVVELNRAIVLLIKIC